MHVEAIKGKILQIRDEVSSILSQIQKLVKNVSGVYYIYSLALQRKRIVFQSYYSILHNYFLLLTSYFLLPHFTTHNYHPILLL